MRFLIIYLLCKSAFACVNDLDCGIGSTCVKPNKSYQMTGTCLQGKNEWKSTITEMSSCQFNHQCKWNERCIIQQGEVYGICSR